MTSVNPGSVPQNWRASSRAAAVQRLWPIITWTVSPGRTLRATASAREVTTGPAGAEAAGVTRTGFASGDETRNSWSRLIFGPNQT